MKFVRKHRKQVSLITIVPLFALIFTLNLAMPPAATAAVAPAAPTACVVALTDADMNAVTGAVNWTAVLDGVCVGAGIGSLFAKLNPYVGLFCAGYALGRFLGTDYS